MVLDFDVETDDDGIRSACQQHVGFGNRSDAGVDDLEVDFLALDLIQARRSVLRANLARRTSRRCADVSCPSAASRRLSSVARCGMLNLSVAPRRRDVPRSSVLAERSDSITRNSSPASGRPVKPSTFTGVEGPASLIGLPLIVHERFHFAAVVAADERIAHLRACPFARSRSQSVRDPARPALR